MRGSVSAVVPRISAPLRRQRGLSLVELLVGITVGMFVVAAAATMVATQLTDNRRMQLEIQVQQDLRATADIVTRDIRRAGACCNAGEMSSALGGIWRAEAGSAPNNASRDVTPAAGTATEVGFHTSRRQGTDGPFGFRFNSSAGTIQVRYTDPSSAPGAPAGSVTSSWQTLTDEATLEVTAFNITADNEPPLLVACPRRCSDGTTNCWPRILVRSFTVEISGRSRADPAIVRSVRSVARLRNDRVEFNNGALAPSCPI